MLEKIRYRLCFNYANRLNKQGRGLVALECRQGKRKIYISSQVLLYPNQWAYRQIVNHENASKLMVYLTHWRNSIEEIELDALLKGKHLTLLQLKTAIKTGLHSSATLAEFTEAVIKDSCRGKTTKQGYKYMVRDIEKEYGKISLEDITHDWIERWRSLMRSQHLSENTIKGRMKRLRCLINEAMKRNLLTDDPFKWITIGNMTPRKGDYLEAEDVRLLEQAKLEGRESHIRDAFLFCVYTGLRFGDFIRLKDNNIINDKLVIDQQKTGNHLELPIKQLFGGKALQLIDKYPSLEAFAKIGVNTTANRTLKDIAKKLKLSKEPHWHSSRKTCATLLNQAGLQMQEIQFILGHSRLEVTERHYATTAFSQVEKSLSKVFKNKEDSQ